MQCMCEKGISLLRSFTTKISMHLTELNYNIIKFALSTMY